MGPPVALPEVEIIKSGRRLIIRDILNDVGFSLSPLDRKELEEINKNLTVEDILHKKGVDLYSLEQSVKDKLEKIKERILTPSTGELENYFPVGVQTSISGESHNLNERFLGKIPEYAERVIRYKFNSGKYSTIASGTTLIPLRIINQGSYVPQPGKLEERVLTIPIEEYFKMLKRGWEDYKTIGIHHNSNGGNDHNIHKEFVEEALRKVRDVEVVVDYKSACGGYAFASGTALIPKNHDKHSYK